MVEYWNHNPSAVGSSPSFVKLFILMTSLFFLEKKNLKKTNNCTMYFHNMSKSTLRVNLALFHYIEKVKPFFIKKFINKFFLIEGKKERAEKFFNDMSNSFNKSLLRSNFYVNFLLYKAYPLNLYFKVKNFKLYTLNTLYSNFIPKVVNTSNKYISYKWFYLNKTLFSNNIYKISHLSNLRIFLFARLFFLRTSIFQFFYKLISIFFTRKKEKKYFKGYIKGVTLNYKKKIRNIIL